jgi:regulator of RNase E activity RraA
MESDAANVIDSYAGLAAALVYDVLDTMGYPNQALAADIKPLVLDNSVLVGRAFTIEGREPSVGSHPKMSQFEMFRLITPGVVIVMASGEHRISGPWGGNGSISAKKSGARGIVMDCATRDATEIIDMGFPTFCRSVTPVFSSGRFEVTRCGAPVSMPGQVENKVVVNTGDLVIADRDGVVIVPAALAEEVLDATLVLKEVEERIQRDLLAGVEREVVYTRHPKFAHIRRRAPG